MNTEENSNSSQLNPEEREILKQCCEEVGVPSDIVERMISAESKVFGMGRRHGIWETLELIVNEGIELEESGGQK